MDAIQDFYLNQGVLGVSLLIAFIVIIFLVRFILKLLDKSEANAEARRLEYLALLERITNVLEANTNSNRILAEKIEAGKPTQGKS
jgi:hypothetical protein